MCMGEILGEIFARQAGIIYVLPWKMCFCLIIKNPTVRSCWLRLIYCWTSADVDEPFPGGVEIGKNVDCSHAGSKVRDVKS